MTNSTASIKKIVRVSSMGLLVATIALLPSATPQAQRAKEPPPKVTGIYSRKTADGEVITISTDRPLSGTQTWQDADGKFHLTLPGSGESSVRGTPRGVKVNRVGNSLEIEVPAKPGANVTVQPGSNRLELVVSGGGNSTASAPVDNSSMPEQGAPDNSGPLHGSRTSRVPLPRRNANDTALWTAPPPIKQPESATSAPAPSNNPVPAAGSNTAQANAPLIIPSPATSAGVPPPAATPQPQPQAAPQEGDIFSYIFSLPGLIIFLGLALVALFLMRRQQNSLGSFQEESTGETTALSTTSVEPGERRSGERRKKAGRRSGDQPASLAKATPTSYTPGAEPHEQTLEVRQSALVPTTLFGAYRVDQEVGKLIFGQPHRIDVLASRATDDRRAIESSLIRAMNAPETDEDGRRRVRQALEEYGFVARQSAALLLAQDTYERTSAARLLGEIGSPAALPFLLEALYDTEIIVRNQAVTSLGALKLPSAIGALLDMARRYPDMPSSLLSRALSDCSIECLDIFGTSTPERTFLSLGSGEPFSGEITHLEPVATVEELPEWIEDEALEEALARLQSQDVEERAGAVQSLSQFQVRRSVEALTMIATSDPEAGLRSAAVTSLGAIDHESVFAPVLIAFVDEAREVRAAAARALSRLNFDRADAYVRVIETADAETLRNVACACIKAGMASQAIDRLASEDRRQAYEAFSLISLLAKSNEIEPILDAIEHHGEIEVRLAAVRALGLAGHPEAGPYLRQLAVRDSVPEKVRMALLEVVYKMDQAQPV